MSLIGWILLGELLLVSVVGAVVAVVAAKVKQRRLMAAVGSLLERARSGEARRIEDLAGRCAEVYRLDHFAAEDLAREVTGEEMRLTASLARALLAQDLATIKNLDDLIAKLVDRQLAVSSAALAPRLAALEAQAKPVEAAVPEDQPESEQPAPVSETEPVVDELFGEAAAEATDETGMLGAADETRQTELLDTAPLDLDGPDSSGQDEIDELLLELGDALHEPASQPGAAPSVGLSLDDPDEQEADTLPSLENGWAGEVSHDPVEPEPDTAMDLGRMTSMPKSAASSVRRGGRPANPLWGIAPADTGLPEELATAASDLSETQENAGEAQSPAMAEMEAPELLPMPQETIAAPQTGSKSGRERRPTANPLYAMAPSDAGVPDDLSEPASTDDAVESASEVGVPRSPASAAGGSIPEHSALADLEAALEEFEALLPAVASPAPAGAEMVGSRPNGPDSEDAETAGHDAAASSGVGADASGLAAADSGSRKRSTRRRNKKSQGKSAEDSGQDG